MIKLPPPPNPRGNYRPAVTFEWIVQVSGQVSRDDSGMAITGQLAPGDDLAVARQAAELAMLRCLSALEAEIGSLDRIAQILMVRGYIRSTPDFEAHPQVMDAASDLLVSVLGQRGQHARAALGVASLPGGGLVEIELSAVLKS
jgi:enamine deaminase RidA (YjgF/YER057c/UK114 family)